MEPEVGFEPTTFRLRVGCATTTPLGLAERVGVKAECIEGGWGRAREMGLGGGLAGAAEKEGASEGDDGGDGQEPQVVREVAGDAFADLVEAEELVLDGAVVEVEGAGAEEDAGEGDAGSVLGGSAAFDELDEADDQDDGAEEVEQAVGDEPGRRGRAVVEVVPAEELVEDDLVQGAGETDADQDGRPEQGRTVTRGRSYHLLGERVPRGREPETGA
jgi:hypothetical protein